MFNAIDEVQRQYMYTVQPVKLFETNKSKDTQQYSFDFISQMNKNGNNPFHPDISNSEKGNKLDFLG
ncbi:hypothetical protein IJ541_04035 [bacterium]|nr:hypothetical protein [bacterium]